MCSCRTSHLAVVPINAGGSRLMAAVAQEARAQGFEHAWLSGVSLSVQRTFYERQGYRCWRDGYHPGFTTPS